ncbi:MAG: MFS transporter, partial [Dehalococcoidales bacterium]|nr:MFS transporter [Dehalococcoidales bacterium]
ISASVEPKKRGRALGIHLVGGAGSYFLVPIIAAAIAAAWGWRGAFIGLAIPTAAFGIIFYVLLRRRAGTSQVQQVITSQRDETSPAPGHLRRLVVFMILSVFTSGVVMSITAFVPLYIVDHFGVSEQTAASSLAIIFSAGFWAGPLGGYLSDRLGRVPVVLATSLISGPLIYLLNLVSSSLGIGALLLIIGIVMYIRMPASESYIIGQVPARHRSMIYGIYYAAGIEGSAILTPVMGSFIDRFGFYSSFTIAGIAVVAMMLICSVFLWGRRD